MSLTPGTRFGPFDVIGQIGAGGMGEVWRARDSQLDRDVALKILPGRYPPFGLPSRDSPTLAVDGLNGLDAAHSHG